LIFISAHASASPHVTIVLPQAATTRPARGNAQNPLQLLPFDFAIVYTGFGEKHQPFAWLEKARQERSER
jgi:hypothetical protein